MGVNSEIFKSIKVGNELMNNFKKENNIEQIDNFQDDIQDNMNILIEASTALSKPLIQVDEDELEDELEELINDEIEKDIININLPNVPKNNINETNTYTT